MVPKDRLRVIRICASCNRTPDKLGRWRRPSKAVLVDPTIPLTHGYCPRCLEAFRLSLNPRPASRQR